MIVRPQYHRRLRTSRVAAGVAALFLVYLAWANGWSTGLGRGARTVSQRAFGTRQATAHLAAGARHPPPAPHAPHPSLLAKPLQQPRRNHGCAFLGDTMVLIAGRYAPSVELWDTVTGEQTMVAANHSMLDVNHFQLTVVDDSEIWIPCGFEGSDLDRERHMEDTIIIDAGDGFTIKRGPRLDKPRGGCGALALDVDGPAAPQHVCVFGGSVGSHDKGVFTDTVSCYDRTRQRWHRPLPQLPIPADHLNAVHLPAGVACDGGGGGKPIMQPERVVYLNFRNKSYTTARPEVFALDIVREASGAIDVDGTGAKGWYLAGMSAPEPELTRDAAGIAVSPSGRFIFTFGGIHYPKVRENYVVFADIIAIDTCTGRSVVLPEHVDMRTPRFAVVSCDSPGGSVITCGGTCKTPGNLASCDVHSLSALEELAVQVVNNAD
jgi:hypothetical protein